MASLTVATKTSPMVAYRRRVPPSTLMHRTVLAPELSATLRRLSCWIIASPGPFEDFDDPPPLELRGGAGLLDAHPVALLEVVDLVVGVEPGRALEGLLVPAGGGAGRPAGGPRVFLPFRGPRAPPRR